MNQKVYENYAKLAVKIGINLQEGQDVVITASTRLADIVHEIVKVCYENKARYVRIEWTNEQIDKLHWLHADTEVLSEVPLWMEEKAKYNAETLPCRIYVDDADPNAYAGVDVTKMAAVRKAKFKVLKKYRDMSDNKDQWLIVAVPSPSWAKTVFPELETEEAVAKLWEAIIKTMRLDAEDPVAAWEEHIANLSDKSDKMNAMNLDYLTYKSANGTDLTVKLQPNHIWLSARETNLKGVDCLALITRLKHIIFTKDELKNNIDISFIRNNINNNSKESATVKTVFVIRSKIENNTEQYSYYLYSPNEKLEPITQEELIEMYDNKILENIEGNHHVRGVR